MGCVLRCFSCLKLPKKLNSRRRGLRLQCETELGRSTMKLFDDTLSVLLFIVVRTGVAVIHAKAHSVVKQYGDFTCRCGHCLGIPDARSKSSVECAEGGMSASNRRGGQS